MSLQAALGIAVPVVSAVLYGLRSWQSAIAARPVARPEAQNGAGDAVVNANGHKIG